MSIYFQDTQPYRSMIYSCRTPCHFWYEPGNNRTFTDVSGSNIFLSAFCVGTRIHATLKYIPLNNRYIICYRYEPNIDTYSLI